MQRLLSQILIGLYLVFGSGLVLNIHYCKGKVKELKPYASVSVCCEHSSSSNETVLFTHCCDLQTIQFFHGGHITPECSDIPVMEHIAVLPRNVVEDEVRIPEIFVSFALSRDGPKRSPDLYALNCARLYYS